MVRPHDAALGRGTVGVGTLGVHRRGRVTVGVGPNQIGRNTMIWSLISLSVMQCAMIRVSSTASPMGCALVVTTTPGSGFAPRPLTSKANHRTPVARNQDPLLGCGPFQHIGIRSSFGQRVLRAPQVQIWLATAKAADDPAIDVGITCQPQHCLAPQ